MSEIYVHVKLPDVLETYTVEGEPYKAVALAMTFLSTRLPEPRCEQHEHEYEAESNYCLKCGENNNDT